MHFYGYNEDSLRSDGIIVGGIPLKIGCHSITSLPLNNNLDNIVAYFTTFKSDGDIIEDEYRLDTSRRDNKIEITKLDTSRMWVEGKIAVSFIFANMRKKENRFNYDTMRFYNGEFRGFYEN